jgi:hypothetical protein
MRRLAQHRRDARLASLVYEEGRVKVPITPKGDPAFEVRLRLTADKIAVATARR